VRPEDFRGTEQHDQAMHQRGAAKAGPDDRVRRQEAAPG
jgi:hypothetical protein